MAVLRHRLKHRARRAFTLLEVMLVLTLLVVIAAFAWPAFKGPMSANRVYRSGEKIRAEWRQARVDAMSSGATRIFRFTPDENGYSIESESDCPFLGADDTFGAGAFAAQDTATSATGSSKQRTLPDDVAFGQCEVETDTRADMYTADSDSSSYTSRPILFFPDGTTSTARLLLKNERGDQVEVRLRGLTGIVAVDWAESIEEGL